MAKIWNAKKDDEEIINAPGLHIGPEQKEAREKARVEFREGVQATTHMIIGKGGIFFKVYFFRLISTTFEFSRQNDIRFSLELTFQQMKFG